jgi:hypothetical protein
MTETTFRLARRSSGSRNVGRSEVIIRLSPRNHGDPERSEGAA